MREPSENIQDERSSRLRLYVSIFAGILVILGSFWLSRLSIDLTKLAGIGYLGVFVATLIGSATLFFPVPNIATVFAAGILLNPFYVSLASGMGSSIGELVGYYIGVTSGEFPLKTKLSTKLPQWLTGHQGITIFLMALIPNPFFDLAGIVAGISRFPVWKFIVAVFIGKTLRSLILSYFGSLLR